jgi:type VI secretion system protein VasD
MIPRRPLLLLPAAMLWGCGGPPPPGIVELTMVGGANQNPDPSGQAVPVAVKVFQLKATAKFERGDYFALREREQATLGEDSAASEEFVLAPRETRELTREMRNGVRFLGVAVGFRDIDRATWRLVQPVAASGTTRLRLTIDGTTARLAPA